MKDYTYVEYILKRRSFPDFLKAVGYKVDLKEWTECAAMLQIGKNILGQRQETFKPDLVIDAGCGVRPTLAVLLALNIKSLRSTPIIAIDPVIYENLGTGIENLSLSKRTVGAWAHNDGEFANKNAIVFCNHAHVGLNEVRHLLNKFSNWIYITSPCCLDNVIPNKLSLFYQDQRVWSAKNKYYIFESIH